MNRTFLLLITVVLASCQYNPEEKKAIPKAANTATVTLDNFDWLLGNWKRNNEESGKETFENWSKLSTTEYRGIGFTMQEKDTIKQETIRLIHQNNAWVLEVKTPEEKEATAFKMTNYSENKFTCENNEIDFPNVITYWKEGEVLNASVAGGEFEIAFEFEKINVVK